MNRILNKNFKLSCLVLFFICWQFSGENSYWTYQSTQTNLFADSLPHDDSVPEVHPQTLFTTNTEPPQILLNIRNIQRIIPSCYHLKYIISEHTIKIKIILFDEIQAILTAGQFLAGFYFVGLRKLQI